MNKVYRHHSFARDEYLGRVADDGRVYDSRPGPDRYIGRVELEDGKIYESRLGPDQHIGHVEVKSGKVYLDKLGPDEYLGRVTEDGKLYRHNPVAPDEYLGKVTEMVSVVHGGAAFLLLVVPAYDQEKEANEASEPSGNEAETGGAPAEA
jgi:hypothetical protein